MSDPSHPYPDETVRRPSGIVPIFITGFAMLLLFWVGTKILFEAGPELTDEETTRSVERDEIRMQYLETVDQELNAYAWKNEEDGLVQIPVERAMELQVLAYSQNNEVQAAYPIDPLAAPAGETDIQPPSETPEENDEEEEDGEEQEDDGEEPALDAEENGDEEDPNATEEN